MKLMNHTRADLLSTLTFLTTEELTKIADATEDDQLGSLTTIMILDCVKEIITARQASVWLQNNTPSSP